MPNRRRIRSARHERAGAPGPSTFGERLQSERRRLAFTQEAIAARAGISRTSQTMYEGDASSPSLPYLRLLIELGMDVHWILSGETRDEYVVRTLDLNLVKVVVESIESWAATRGRATSDETKNALFRVIYQSCAREGFSAEKAREVFQIAEAS